MLPVDAKWAPGTGWTFHVPVRLTLGQLDQAIRKGLIFYKKLYLDLEAADKPEKEEIGLALQDLRAGRVRQLAKAKPLELLKG